MMFLVIVAGKAQVRVVRGHGMPPSSGNRKLIFVI
jgi:hypothetical protein